MAVSSNMIEELIRKINAAENNRPNTTIDAMIEAIDAVCSGLLRLLQRGRTARTGNGAQGRESTVLQHP